MSTPPRDRSPAWDAIGSTATAFWSSQRLTDPRDKILATGIVDDAAIFRTTRFQDGADLSMDDLATFDAVLTYRNDSHEDSEALGTLLADSVAAGPAS